MQKYIVKFWYGFGFTGESTEPLTELEAQAKIAAVALNGGLYLNDRKEFIPWHRITRVTLSEAVAK